MPDKTGSKLSDKPIFFPQEMSDLLLLVVGISGRYGIAYQSHPLYSVTSVCCFAMKCFPTADQCEFRRTKSNVNFVQN